MTLLTAGYWPSTYWAENYFMPQYWPFYGTAVIITSKLFFRISDDIFLEIT